MSKHTPGPWIADDNEGFSAWAIWSGSAPSGHGDGAKIATVNGDSEESDANARLIASAPDLLRFAEDFLRAWENGKSDRAHLKRKAIEVIAKAKG